MKKPQLTLYRISSLSEGTQGVLINEEGKLISCMMELPWRNNQKNISCIPEGTYEVEKRAPSDKFHYDHFILNHVPERSAILIHKGNWAGEDKTDSQGCLLPCECFINDPSQKNGLMGSASKNALETLLAEYPNGFTLKII